MTHTRIDIIGIMVFHPKVRIASDRKLTKAYYAIFLSTLSMSLLVPSVMASMARVQLDRLSSHD